MWDSWNEVFRQVLGPADRTLVSELRDVRNRWAHQENFSGDDAYRALDSASRLLSAVSAQRYRGLRGGKQIVVTQDDPALLVKPEVAQRQLSAETAAAAGVTGSVVAPGGALGGASPGSAAGAAMPTAPTEAPKPKRFHGSVTLDPTRVGRDAGRIAEEVIAHLAGLTGAQMQVTLEITATIPGGAPEQVVRTVTENSRTLKFTSQGFETE